MTSDRGKPKYLAKVQFHYNYVHHKGYKICSEIKLDPRDMNPTTNHLRNGVDKEILT
jgi:hypothetical protein